MVRHCERVKLVLWYGTHPTGIQDAGLTTLMSRSQLQPVIIAAEIGGKRRATKMRTMSLARTMMESDSRKLGVHISIGLTCSVVCMNMRGIE